MSASMESTAPMKPSTGCVGGAPVVISITGTLSATTDKNPAQGAHSKAPRNVILGCYESLSVTLVKFTE